MNMISRWKHNERGARGKQATSRATVAAINGTASSRAVAKAGAVALAAFAACAVSISGRAGHAEPIMLTIAGGGDYHDGGPALATSFAFPTGLAVDLAGNVYISDETHHSIRKLDPATGVIATTAGIGVAGFTGDGGPAVQAAMNLPSGIALDRAGKNLYIADRFNFRIRKVDLTTGIITTVAGNGVRGFGGDNGPALAAMFNYPIEVAVDPDDNIYVADQYNNRVRRVDGVTGVISTVAGNGAMGYNADGIPAIKASLNVPSGLTTDRNGNLYIADKDNHRVRFVDRTSGFITTIAGVGSAGRGGDGGPARDARLYKPANLAWDRQGNLYVTDEGNNVIRRIEVGTLIISTYAGTGRLEFSGDNMAATDASFVLPTGFASPQIGFDRDNNLYIADRGNARIRKVDGVTGLVSTVAGGGDLGDGQVATNADFGIPPGIFVDRAGNLFVTDRGNARIRRVDATSGIITTVAGQGYQGYGGDGGPATEARFVLPMYAITDVAGNLYIADQYSHRIRRVDAVTGIITTFAGVGIPGYSGDNRRATHTRLFMPQGLAFDAAGNLYIADQLNHRIRKVDARTNMITTVAGDGSAGFGGDGGAAVDAMLDSPIAVALDSRDNVFIADRFNQRVRKVDAATGIITTVAGSDTKGYAGDGGPAVSARLDQPCGVAVDSADDLYIADFGNAAIRKVNTTTGIISTVAGNGTHGFSGDGGAATSAQMNLVMSVAVDQNGNLYIADVANNRIRAVIRH